jgi:hypothetical protein
MHEFELAIVTARSMVHDPPRSGESTSFFTFSLSVTLIRQFCMPFLPGFGIPPQEYKYIFGENFDPMDESPEVYVM